MAEFFGVHWVSATESTTAATSWTTAFAAAVETDNSQATTQRPCEDAGTASNIWVKITSTGHGGTSNYTFVHGGTVSSLSAAITASTAGEYEDSSNTATVSAGQDLTFRIVLGSGTLIIASSRCEMDFDSDVVSLIGVNSNGSSNFTSDSSTTYLPPHGKREFNATEGNKVMECQEGGTWSDLAVRTGAVARTSDSFIRTRIDTGGGSANGNQVLTVTGTDDNVWLQETSNTDTVNDGDDINYSVVNGTGTGEAFNIEKVTSSLVNTLGETFHLLQGNDERVTTSTYYFPYSGELGPEKTVVDDAAVTAPFAYTAGHLRAQVTRETGSTNYDFHHYFNGAAGNCTLNFTNEVARKIDTSNTDSVSAGHDVLYRVTYTAGTNIDIQQIGIQTKVTVGGGGLSIPVAMNNYRQHHQSVA